MKLFRKIKKGFTLIELVVVIAVIAILSGVSVVAYVGITNNAKKSVISQEAAQIALAVRASAQASTEGYDEHDGGPRYNVKFENDTIIIKSFDNDFDAAAVIKDMFKEIEEKDIENTLTIDGDLVTKEDNSLTTNDTEIDNSKTYYTKSDDGYSKVTSADKLNLENYWEYEMKYTVKGFTLTSASNNNISAKQTFAK